MILRAEINTNVSYTVRDLLLWLQDVSKPEEISLLILGHVPAYEQESADNP